MTVLIIFFILIIILFLLMPIKVIIYNDKDVGKVELILVKILNYKININQWVDKSRSKKNDNGSIYYRIKMLLLTNKIFKMITNMSYLKKVTFVYTPKNIFEYVAGYNIMLDLNDFLKSNFKQIKSEQIYYYDIKMPNNQERIIKYEIVIYVRLFYLLFTVINKYKEFKAVIKFNKKRRSLVGTSNK